ncbi:MAG TPA: hypothetical protein VLT33_27640 [Labilithrix sp.]|nr:hypothetical protein [Labilithrix sp.]
MSRIARLVPPFVLVLGLCSLAACDEKKTPPTPPTPSATASAAVATTDAAPSAASAAATAAADAGAAPNAHMANCPTATPGATVALKDVEGGIEIAITAKDEAAKKDIKTRMVKLVEADRNEAEAGVKHDHGGSGGGVYGRCTIVMRNTKLETADLPDGVKATVKAKDKTEVDWLRRETRERDKDAKAPAAEGAGTHRMAHCPSAVPGSKTAVKDSKEGVIVTVTGTGDAVKDIRERAKHAAEISKLAEPPKPEHNSEGKGGGGLGRCPVVVEGDTTVEAKDVENGSEITVKAKKDVAALQKETKLRAGNFGAK